MMNRDNLEKMDKVEIVLCDSQDDFTIKIFNRFRIDSKYYSEVVLETDSESKMIGRSKPRETILFAKNDALEMIKQFLENEK